MVKLLAVSMMFVTCAGMSMTWIPNTEGLFSQFLQMHIMMYVKDDLNLKAIMVPTFNTTHTEDVNVNICKVFQLPVFVQCGSVQRVNGSKCRENSIALRRHYYHDKVQRGDTLVVKDLPHVCYNMISPFLGGQTRRDAFLRVVSFIPQVEFQLKHRRQFQAYKRHLLNSNDPSIQYTVVHWRRGDQLQSRCTQGKDTSVNCLSVNDLIHEVKRYTSDNIIYLATNEVNLSRAEVDYLRQANIHVFDPRAAGYHAGSVAAAVVDVQLMLDATTFLGWGVSIIHDLMEHARMVQNRSWCTAVETNVTYPTWCWLQAQRVDQARAKIPDQVGIPPSLRQQREILLHADQYMRTRPLVISEYNISNMPAYQFEIQDCARRMKNLV